MKILKSVYLSVTFCLSMTTSPMPGFGAQPTPRTTIPATTHGSPIVRVWSLAFHPNGKLLASATNEDVIRIWDVKSGKLDATMWGQSRVKTIAYSPDGSMLAGVCGTEIWLWDTRTGHVSTKLQAFVAPEAIAFSPDSTFIASTPFDANITIWNIATRTNAATLKHESSVNSFAISPDGKTLAAATQENTIKLWSVANGRPESTLTGHTRTIACIAFVPDGKALVSGSADGTIRVWDLSVNKERVVIPGTAPRFVVTPDGDGLIACGGDRIIFWDIAKAKNIVAFDAHKGVVSSLALSSTGEILASGGMDKQIKIWTFASIMGRE